MVRDGGDMVGKIDEEDRERMEAALRGSTGVATSRPRRATAQRGLVRSTIS